MRVNSHYAGLVRSLQINHARQISDSEPDISVLALTIHEIRAAGFVTWRAMTDELNRRRIPSARGGRWHCTSLGRVLARLGMTTPGKRGGNGACAIRNAGDMRAKALAPTIHALQATGFVSQRAIANELNMRRIPGVRGGKWHRTSVARLLARLKREDTHLTT